jgi:hypothetical protein
VSIIKVMSNARMISKLMGKNNKHNESCENIISKQTRRSLITIKNFVKEMSQSGSESGRYSKHSLSRQERGKR